jgi:hypothetical protein
MDISARRQIELEARSSSGSSLRAATALGFLLAVSQPATLPVLVLDRRVVLRETDGTAAEPMSLRITEADLFAQINRVYDDLLRKQVDLDFDARKILYRRLWNLYS